MRINMSPVNTTRLGEHDKAIADYSEAIRVDPKEADAYINRGSVFESKGELDRAIADFSQAIRLDPKWRRRIPPPRFGIAATRRVRQGDRGLLGGRRSGPRHLLTCIAGVLMRTWPGVRPRRRLRTTRRPSVWTRKDAQADYSRGFAYGREGDYDKAIADYSEAIRLDPKLACAYYNRADAYVTEDDEGKALADLTAAIQLDPRYTNAYILRGNVHASKGENDKVIADYSEAIEARPEACAGLLHPRVFLGQRKAARGKALADLDAAVRLSPRTAVYHTIRGTIRVREGDYGGGLADLRAGIALDAGDPAANFENWPKAPLTAAAMRFRRGAGAANAPGPARHGAIRRESGPVVPMGRRKFAGEDLMQTIRWDPTEPAIALATNNGGEIGPGGAAPQIRLRETYSEGADRARSARPRICGAARCSNSTISQTGSKGNGSIARPRPGN